MPEPSAWKRRQYRARPDPPEEELAPPGYTAVCPRCRSGNMRPTLPGELWSTYDCLDCHADYLDYYDCLRKT